MKRRLVNDRYDLVVTDHVADWDAPSAWERPRFESMEATLKPGMVLFDIGAEHGWISAVYAGFVGGGNMVLVEPTPAFWPNIRLTWEHNQLPQPRGCFVGLVGQYGDPVDLVEGVWPAEADGPEAPAGGYRYLHEPNHVAMCRVTTVDRIAAQVAPDALTIDVEGAELEVLLGAGQVLRERRPLVWVSVHPELMDRDYGRTPAQLATFMTSVGYVGAHLGTDHEEHWLFTPC